MPTISKIKLNDTVYDLQGGGERYEQQSNKVTSISASSTDVEYPSAKGVFTAITNGIVAAAKRLYTPQSLRVNLASTSAQSFDGSADAINIGISGTLPIANGGTGASTIGGAREALGAPTLNNLLDNSWFSVDQRQGNYDSTYSGTCLDRWVKDSYTKVEVMGNGCINITSYSSDTTGIEQRFEKGVIKTNTRYLCEILLGDNTWITGYFDTPSVITNKTISVAYNSTKHIGIYFHFTANYEAFAILNDGYGRSNSIRAAKLSVGNVYTLKADYPPNYVADLLNCRYYYLKFNNYINHPYFITADKIYTAYNFNTMRAIPSIKVTNIQVHKNGEGIAGFTANVYRVVENQCVIEFDKAAHGIEYTDTCITQVDFEFCADL